MIDATIVRKAQSGDTESFDLIIQSCQTKTYNICLRYLKHEQDALDAMQDIFIKVYRNLDSFKFNSTFETWLYRIVVNTCNDIVRKNAKRKTTDSIHRQRDGEEITLDIVDPGDTPEEAYVEKETHQTILDYIEMLPADQKAVIILRDIHGLSYEEISEITLSAMGTIKSRLNRARRKLKELYVQGTKT